VKSNHLFGLLAMVATWSCSQTTPLDTSSPANMDWKTLSAPTSNPKAPSPESPAERQIAKMLSEVEMGRELHATHAVKGIVLSRELLLKRITEHVKTETPKQVILDQGEILRALELIPLKYNYEKGLFDLLKEELAGYYEPADQTMYLSADLDKELAESTLAHELVHALQDQHFSIGKELKYRPDDSERSTALHAMAEGDAVSAMFDVLLAPKKMRAVDLSDSNIVSKLEKSSSKKSIPKILQDSLIFPYIDGFLFIQNLRRRGGWRDVDKAWKHPPITTEQLLHLDKYDLFETPIAIQPPKVSALGEGWKLSSSESQGEQGWRLILRQWTSLADAKKMSAGWGGDRLSLMRHATSHGTEIMLLWHTEFDPGTDACNNPKSIMNVVTKHFKASASSSSWVCHERRTLGPLAVARSACGITVLAGPYSVSKGKFRSQSTCEEQKSLMKSGKL
jgi:hypothetical protein